MTAVALVGDCTTTTAVALATAWPDSESAADQDVIVVEIDPRGGSLAAWLDTPLSPSLSTVVTTLHQTAATGSAARPAWNSIDAMIRRSPAGVRFIPAPFRSIEARRAVIEAEHALLPLLARVPHASVLLDVGPIDPANPPAAADHADITVVCHRLDTSSAPAATVRLERMAESVEALRNGGRDVAVIVIGDDPFPLDEVLHFVAPGARGWQLAVDTLAAAVLAGRTGVSARRLRRLPLIRSATRIASDLATMLEPNARTSRTAYRSAPTTSTAGAG